MSSNEVFERGLRMRSSSEVFDRGLLRGYLNEVFERGYCIWVSVYILYENRRNSISHSLLVSIYAVKLN